MKSFIFTLLLLASASAMAQRFHVAASSAFGPFIGDEKSQMTRSFGIGAGYALHSGGRWAFSATAMAQRERYQMKDEGPTFYADEDRANLIAQARWRFLSGDEVPYIGMGFFGSRMLKERSYLPLWSYGPTAGIGVQWQGGFLEARYQQALEKMNGRRQGSASITFALNIIHE